jgi:hypothetical protein
VLSLSRRRLLITFKKLVFKPKERTAETRYASIWIEAVKKPSDFHLAKKACQTRGMSQENPISKQPLIRHVNRQQ